MATVSGSPVLGRATRPSCSSMTTSTSSESCVRLSVMVRLTSCGARRAVMSWPLTVTRHTGRRQAGGGGFGQRGRDGLHVAVVHGGGARYCRAAWSGVKRSPMAARFFCPSFDHLGTGRAGGGRRARPRRADSRGRRNPSTGPAWRATAATCPSARAEQRRGYQGQRPSPPGAQARPHCACVLCRRVRSARSGSRMLKHGRCRAQYPLTRCQKRANPDATSSPPAVASASGAATAVWRRASG